MAGADEVLAAKIGVHRHHEDEVERIEHYLEQGYRRRGVQGYACLCAGIMYQAHEALGMGLCLPVKGHDVGPGLQEPRDAPRFSLSTPGFVSNVSR